MGRRAQPEHRRARLVGPIRRIVSPLLLSPRLEQRHAADPGEQHVDEHRGDERREGPARQGRKRDQGDNVPFGDGDTKIVEVLQLLREKKYPIPANIEYEYKGDDTVEEVRKCLDYCKAALA